MNSSSQSDLVKFLCAFCLGQFSVSLLFLVCFRPICLNIRQFYNHHYSRYHLPTHAHFKHSKSDPHTTLYYYACVSFCRPSSKRREINAWACEQIEHALECGFCQDGWLILFFLFCCCSSPVATWLRGLTRNCFSALDRLEIISLIEKFVSLHFNFFN